MSAVPDLIAADVTLAGNVFPFKPTELGSFSFEQRVEVAKAGRDFGSPVTTHGIDAIRAVHSGDLDVSPLHTFFNSWLRRAGRCSLVDLE